MRETIAAEEARRNLHEFIRQAWPIIEPGTPYLDNWHIGAMCEHLEAVTSGQIRRLLINVPPRYMKSIAVSVMWPVWEWATIPEQRWLFASYAQTLSRKHSLDRRRIIQSDWYRRHFGHKVELAADQNLQDEFANTRRGTMLATSIGGGAIGKGGNRLVFDDPHNPKQAESETERQTALDWLNLSFYPRQDNKKTAAIVGVMQRLHHEDASAQCIEQGYVHLCLQGRAETRTTIVMPSGREIVREEHDLLWPEREGPLEMAETERTLGPYGFAGQYQQRPQPKSGGMFKHAWFEGRIIDAAPVQARRVRYWDTAGTDGGGDYTVGCRIAMTPDRRFFIEDIHRGQWSPGRRNQEILATARRDGTSVIQWVERESGVGGADRTQDIIKLLAGFTIKSEPATGSKEFRAEPFAAQAEAGNVWIVKGEWNHAFLAELCDFGPTCVHDDQVDAASGGLNKLAQAPVSGPPLTGGSRPTLIGHR